LKGKVHDYIQRRIAEKGAIHMTLIDPAEMTPEEAVSTALAAQAAGSSAIMIGGSIGVNQELVDGIIVKMKKQGLEIPVILFPGNPSALSKYADAVWYLSVLNSLNPYFIIGGQMQAAPLVKRMGLEPLPLAYLILGEGGVVGYVSQTRPIPFSKPEIAVAYALAAKYMGFKYVYLEGGSGGKPIPSEVIKAVKKEVGLTLVVGGGIRTPELAEKATRAGADIVVTGNIVEEVSDVEYTLKSIVEAVEKGARSRRSPCEP